MDLSKTLVIGISSRALFDLTESERVFECAAGSADQVAIYRDHMLKTENEALVAGTGMPLVRALLKLNQHAAPADPRLVEVVVMSKNSPETGMRIMNTIRSERLDITRSAFTGGESVAPYLEAFGVHLFLTKSNEDAQAVMDMGKCAVAVLQPPPSEGEELSEDQVRIAFDGDAVLFGEEGEVHVRQHGMKSFHEQQDTQCHIPLSEGPFANFLRKLAQLQKRLPHALGSSPVRIALVTARNGPPDRRTILTLRHWEVYLDSAFFLGGIPKASILRAFKPHIFFDDQEKNVISAGKYVPTGGVPYKSGSPLSHQHPAPLDVTPETVGGGSEPVHGGRPDSGDNQRLI